MEATETIAPPRREQQHAGVRSVGLWLERLFELDFTRPLAFAVLGIIFVAVRAYWLDLGYGTDPDAWRVAMTATYLWETGDYLPSRLPGYPLHEFVTAALIKGGWIATNASTMIASLVGVYVFASIARKLELPSKGVLTIAFAFTPLLWINSVMTMDYMWALTLVMGAYLLLLHRSPSLAGVLLGIAAGFRLTSLFMLPIFWLLLWRSKERGAIRSMTFPALAVALVVYMPVLLDYGINFLNFYDQDVVADEFVKRLGKDGLGIIGAFGLLIGLLLSLPRLRRLPRDLRADPHVLMWCAVLVLYVLSYLRLPHEIAYLIPLFPFGYFLMSRYMARPVLVATLGLIVLAGFVDVTSPDDEIGLSTSTFTSASIGKGMLLSDIDTLQNQMEFARELRELTVQNDYIQRPAVIATGFIYPELVMLHEDELELRVLEEDVEAISQLSDKGYAIDEANELYYVWLLEFDDFEKLRGAQQRTVYYTADAARSTFAVYGYRPAYFDAIELPLSRENPSLGEGTATTDR
jgi:hypothetical protein